MKPVLLVVTDHQSHTATNSLYALCRALHDDPRCGEVWVASKGHPLNAPFFEGETGAIIHALPVDSAFNFHPDGIEFIHRALPLSREKINGILLRMPQPLDPVFLLSLQSILPSTRIINSPAGCIETSSKAFLLQLPHLCPDPMLCNTPEEAITLCQKKEIVLKPLYSYGGRGIIRLSPQHIWREDVRYDAEHIPAILQKDLFPMMAFRFLKNVWMGDKRTIVVNRKIMGSALRLPPPGSWMCNVAQGGHAILAEADEDEHRIEAILTPLLFEKGVVMYGFDTLVDDTGRRVLSEINTLSIGGLLPLAEMSDLPVLQQTASRLWDYLLSTC